MIAKSKVTGTPPEQKAFYDAYGFLVLRRAFEAGQVDRIQRAYEHVMTRALNKQGKHRDKLEEHFVIGPAFCHRHPNLLALHEDDRIKGTVDVLLGPGSFFQGGD